MLTEEPLLRKRNPGVGPKVHWFPSDEGQCGFLYRTGSRPRVEDETFGRLQVLCPRGSGVISRPQESERDNLRSNKCISARKILLFFFHL